MNVCRDAKGQFARLLTGKSPVRAAYHKKKGLQAGAPKKYNCKTKPRMIKGRCKCTSKTGTQPYVPTLYCKRK